MQFLDSKRRQTMKKIKKADMFIAWKPEEFYGWVTYKQLARCECVIEKKNNDYAYPMFN